MENTAISDNDFIELIKQKKNDPQPSLILNDHAINSVPEQIGICTNLSWLSLDDNGISNLPETVSNLKSLKFLSLARNNISSIPPCIFDLDELVSLDLSGNNIETLPREIGRLTNLTRLNLSNNKMTELPEEIARMSSLGELIVSQNLLSTLPSTIAGARHLSIIDVQGNQIAHLPPQIALLEDLKSLVLKDNPIISPPIEVVSQGTKAVTAFLRNLQVSMVRRFEAKLLILGEGGVGKSSLLRRFKNEDFDPHLFTTRGIDVSALPMRHPDDYQESIQMNVWDFAGQEIEHATHQFFMSDPSIYLLVWNARHGQLQGRLAYWLERIKSHAPHSPVVLVATHTDERQPDVNFESYQSTYSQLREECNVDNKNGTGAPYLKSVIARHASKLPYMGQHWPLSWQQVENELKDSEDHHISYALFRKICSKAGIETAYDVESLSATLHSLGIILHFKDDPALRDLVILKPDWITKAISLALSDKETANSFGCLNHNDLPRIWRTYDSSLYASFFGLMNKFELCYQMENSENKSLIPALLPYKPPPHEIAPTLQMVFKLSSVPAGLMSRFIVRTHRFTSNIHWREGAVLNYDGQVAKAELSEDKKEFVLSAEGSYPTYFFSVLMDTVDQILRNYPGLTVDRMIPCTCSAPGLTEEWCGHYFTLKELNNYIAKQRVTIDCRETTREVNVVGLLYGIHDASRARVIGNFGKVVEAKKDSETPILFSEKNRQLIRLAQRGVTDFFNKNQNEDVSCPPVFTLSREDDQIGVNLVCQCEEGWHLSSAKTVIKVDNDLKNKSDLVPLIAEYTQLLESIIPLAGIKVNFETPITDAANEKHEDNMRFMRELVGMFSNSSGRVEGVQKSLLNLYGVLSATHDQHGYTGLKQTMTPDGYRVWLCPYHYAQLQPGSLNTMQKKFDAFLCHNSKDKEFVRSIYDALEDHDVNCWIDEEEILGGDRWQDSMARGIEESKSTIVCIGPNDWGNWQYEELQVALSMSAGQDSNHLVIPLLIPPLTSVPAHVPSFLRTRHALRLSSIDNEREFDKLIKSIVR